MTWVNLDEGTRCALGLYVQSGTQHSARTALRLDRRRVCQALLDLAASAAQAQLTDRDRNAHLGYGADSQSEVERRFLNDLRRAIVSARRSAEVSNTCDVC